MVHKRGGRVQRAVLDPLWISEDSPSTRQSQVRYIRAQFLVRCESTWGMLIGFRASQRPLGNF
jgi:hypothetical protein